MNHFTNQDRARRTEVLQHRFARRVADALTQRVATETRPDIDERLRVAREQAVARARAQQRLAPAGSAVAMGGGTLAMGGPGAGGDTPWWLRLSSLLPLAVLLAGLLLIDHRYTQSQIEAAAEVDAALLVDDLPPEAYQDPGFTEFPADGPSLMFDRVRPLLVALALVAGAATAQAQSLVGPSPTGWNALTASQRGVLAPLERDWSQITPAQQQKWVEVANRYGSMTPDERRRAQDRMAEWSRLSPNERARARLNFQEVRQLSPEERQAQWEAYRALPPAQKREFAERAQSRPAPVASPRRDNNAGEKSALVRSPASPQPQPVGPTVVQRGAGATTSLVSKPTRPPLHQQAGLPKVAATPGFVDADTLLPQRGAQGAARPVRNDDRRGKNEER